MDEISEKVEESLRQIKKAIDNCNNDEVFCDYPEFVTFSFDDLVFSVPVRSKSGPVFDELSMRSRNILRRMGVETIKQLSQQRKQDLLDARNCGVTAVAEMEMFLIANGLSFKGQ